jgi:hypothetical protein
MRIVWQKLAISADSSCRKYQEARQLGKSLGFEGIGLKNSIFFDYLLVFLLHF